LNTDRSEEVKGFVADGGSHKVCDAEQGGEEVPSTDKETA
jgi:hypothetical protein